MREHEKKPSHAGQWSLSKTDPGFTLTRKRNSIFNDSISIYIPPQEIEQWRASFATMVQRVHRGHYRTLPITPLFRCLLGCWQSKVHTIRFYGRLCRQPGYIVSLGESLYFALDVYNWRAYPISRENLADLKSQLDKIAL